MHTLSPTEATIVALEVITGHNSRTDRARKSLKISWDSEDSNRSDEFKKREILKFWEKCKFWFCVSHFLGHFRKIQKISFYAHLLAFSKCFFGLDYVWRPQLKKNPTKMSHHCFGEKTFGWKTWGGSKDFWMTSSWPEKKIQGVIFLFLLLK